MKLEAEIGVMWPHVKEYQEPLKAGRGKKGFSLRAFDFRVLASRTRTEYISVVLSYQVCGNLL